MRYDMYYLITYVLQEIEIHCAEVFPESNPIIIKDFLLIIYEWSISKLLWDISEIFFTKIDSNCSILILTNFQNIVVQIEIAIKHWVYYSLSLMIWFSIIYSRMIKQVILFQIDHDFTLKLIRPIIQIQKFLCNICNKLS